MTLAPERPQHSASFRSRRIQNWVVMGLTYASMYMARYNFGFANKSLSDMYGWNKAQVGAIISSATLVYGIAAHKVADFHRRAGRDRSEPVADVPDSPERDAGPEQQLLEEERRELLVKLLNTLAPTQREILVLRLIVGLSAEETAATIGSTPGAVRVAQHRALARLRRAVPSLAPALAIA